MPSDSDKIEIENVNSPGRVERVDRAKYVAMKKALLSVLPKTSPGLTVAEAKAELLPLLPQALFPEGAKAGWWLKATQLDLEAKGVIQRENSKPLRLRLSNEDGRAKRCEGMDRERAGNRTAEGGECAAAHQRTGTV